MARLRVLHILGELRPSGMERMLESSSDDFAGLGITSHVIGVGLDHPFEPALRDAGYSVSTTTAPLHSSVGRRFLRRVVSTFRPDVVHLHTEGNYFVNVLAIKRAGYSVPIVRTVHNVFAAHGTWFLRRFVQAALADRFVAAVVVPSSDVAINERRFRRRVQVIYNWVDNRFFELAASRGDATSRDPKAPVVVVGNCSWIKNHDLILEAALLGRLTVAHVGSELHAEASEKRLLEELDRAGLLISRGPGDPSDAFVAGKVFAMSSLNEGMPVALAEALVVGLPAVVADAPGLRWSGSEPGVTVVASMEAAAWADALHAATRGREGSTTDFSPARGAAEYTAVYRRLETKKGGAR